MKRKAIASLLAFVLVCSMLMAACGSNNDTPATSDTPSSTGSNTGSGTGGGDNA